MGKCIRTSLECRTSDDFCGGSCISSDRTSGATAESTHTGNEMNVIKPQRSREIRYAAQLGCGPRGLCRCEAFSNCIHTLGHLDDRLARDRVAAGNNFLPEIHRYVSMPANNPCTSA